jgi:chorismate synthase
MSNSIGKNLKLTLFGESHGHGIGCVLDGFPAGYPVDMDMIQEELRLRRPGRSDAATPRKERDLVQIISGVFEGRSTGAPITFLIVNEDTRSGDYKRDVFRPSHADYTAFIKYDGYNDHRGGGMFSGRLTAPIVASGALVKHYLRDKNQIWINSYVSQVGDVIESEPFRGKVVRYEDSLCVLNEETGRQMMEQILKAKEADDSVGGKIKTIVSGLKVGLGEPFFESLESEIGRMMFSIPSVKAVEFGLGTGFAASKGSQVNDAFTVIDDRICTKTNYNGGILGGMSTGMPLEFTLTVKPTASIKMEQDAVDIKERKSVKFANPGRHDPSIVTRIPIVIENATALMLLDLILQENK